MNAPLKQRLLALAFTVLCTASSPGFGQDAAAAEVMLFGVFHFANPGQDVVKTAQVNVMTDANQAYLEQLAARLSTFQPTVVMLEYAPENNDRINQRYRDYVAGTYSLGSNEIYQIGFRVARLAGLDTVFSFDEQSVEWDAGPLFEYMPASDMQAQTAFDELIQSIETSTQTKHSTLSLRDLLIDANDPQQERLNKSIYLLTNSVGATDNFFGADAAASWWHRNFRMYAKIQHAASPGERVLVIGGQGHIAILRDLLHFDLRREAVPVLPHL